MLNVENKNRYTIDGNEAELVFHGDVNTFLIKNCCDITIKNLTIDYYNPTSIELYVKNINEELNYVDFIIPKAFNYYLEENDIIWTSEKNENHYYWMGKIDLNHMR